MIFEIPIENADGDPALKIRTVLEDVEVVLLMQWNTRLERWHVSVMDATEGPLIMGLPMNINLDLITRFEIDGLPPGQLYLADTTFNNQECGIDELGGRCKLFYATAA